MHGNGHAGFGGRPAETDRWQHQHRAAGRPHSFRYASRRDWAAVAKDLKPVYTAPSEQAALDAFAEFCATWETRYPAIVRLWTNAWEGS